MSEAPYSDPSKEISDIYYETHLILWHPNLHNCPRCSGSEDIYVVAEPFAVSFKLNGSGHRITIPKGMVTDLASVPRVFRSLVGRTGKHLEAAIIHDYLYVAWQIHGIDPADDMRLFSDNMMLAAMKASGVGRWKRDTVYFAIRLFGKGAFFSENPIIFCRESFGDDSDRDPSESGE